MDTYWSRLQARFGSDTDISMLFGSLSKRSATKKAARSSKHSSNSSFLNFCLRTPFGHRKSTPRTSKIHSLDALGALLGRSWTVLRRSLGVLGRSLVVIGCPWAVLGCSWSALGRSWGALGALLGALGAPRWRSWAPLGRVFGHNIGYYADMLI